MLQAKKANIDQSWLSELFQLHSRELYWIAMAFCSNKQLAEDAVQEAFLYLCEHPESAHSVSNIKSYLIRVVKNYLVDQFRKEQTVLKHEADVTNEMLYAIDSQYTEEEYQEMLRRVNTILLTLPAGCRRIFIKSVMEGMSYREIADAEGISVNTVKTQLRIAHKRLRGHTLILLLILIEVLK